MKHTKEKNYLKCVSAPFKSILVFLDLKMSVEGQGTLGIPKNTQIIEHVFKAKSNLKVVRLCVY